MSLSISQVPACHEGQGASLSRSTTTEGQLTVIDDGTSCPTVLHTLIIVHGRRFQHSRKPAPQALSTKTVLGVCRICGTSRGNSHQEQIWNADSRSIKRYLPTPCCISFPHLHCRVTVLIHVRHTSIRHQSQPARN